VGFRLQIIVLHENRPREEKDLPCPFRHTAPRPIHLAHMLGLEFYPLSPMLIYLCLSLLGLNPLRPKLMPMPNPKPKPR
jgi:hypothetical protein